MHPGEVAFGDDVVRRLVGSQLPQWAGLPLERIGSSGTVNVLYRSATSSWCACRAFARAATRGR